MIGALARSVLGLALLLAACGAPAGGGGAAGGATRQAQSDGGAAGPQLTAADAPVLGTLSGAERDRVTGLTAYPKTGTRTAGASGREEAPDGESLCRDG